MARLPSMRALRALDAFARHGSVWQAADDLHLTRSAVSHRLRLLERDLDFALIEREGSRVALTPQGRNYAAEVARMLTLLAEAGARQRANRDIGGSLTISVTPGFGAAWLAPRIGQFAALHPAVALHVVAPQRLDDTEQPGVDLFIGFLRLTDGLRRDGVDIRVIAPVVFTPLCAPALLGGAPADPARIAMLPLLHLRNRDDWGRWFDIAGQSATDRPGLIFSDVNLTLSAALAGQGVMLGDPFSCGPSLAAGHLVAPSDVFLPSGHGYVLMVPKGRADSSRVLAAFLAWIDDELGRGAENWGPQNR